MIINLNSDRLVLLSFSYEIIKGTPHKGDDVNVANTMIAIDDIFTNRDGISQISIRGLYSILFNIKENNKYDVGEVTQIIRLLYLISIWV